MLNSICKPMDGQFYTEEGQTDERAKLIGKKKTVLKPPRKLPSTCNRELYMFKLRILQLVL